MYTIMLSELARMDPVQKEQALTNLVEAARSSNGETGNILRERVREFELRYEMSSDELLERLGKGEQRETADIANWLFWINALNDYLKKTRA